MTNFLFRIVATISLLASLVGTVQAQAQAQATGIRVLVYGIHHGGNLVYNYKVVNNGDTPFNNFTVGSEFDTTEKSNFPQLRRLPLGWTYGITGETGTEIVLSAASTNQPPNWTSSVYGKQDTSLYYLEWITPWGDNNISNVISPGQTIAGFSVTIPLEDSVLSLPSFAGQDEKYLKGGFQIGLGSGKKFQKVWGALERLDTTPPTLTVSLSPNKLWPPNKKLVPITATITVKDDYDPQPEIKLESITANETLDMDDAKNVEPGTDNRHFMLKAEREGKNKAGRIYTVTYSATDGSGNKSTASATVTVPHDEREQEGRDKNEKSRKSGKD